MYFWNTSNRLKLSQSFYLHCVFFYKYMFRLDSTSLFVLLKEALFHLTHFAMCRYPECYYADCSGTNCHLKNLTVKNKFLAGSHFCSKIFELKGLFEMEQNVFELSYIIERAPLKRCVNFIPQFCNF